MCNQSFIHILNHNDITCFIYKLILQCYALIYYQSENFIFLIDRKYFCSYSQELGAQLSIFSK
jgi:hypothetical protein